ncbi:hypothetical protein ACHAWF_002965 [Thalassiosira exigua]
MMSSDATTIPSLKESLVAFFGEWKYGHGKNITILRLSAAAISVASSCLLTWVISKSSDRLSTTYHRLLLGMTIGDILYSSLYLTSNAPTPSDMNYMVWNARGNQASCTVVGTFNSMGFFVSIVYNCSLNFYYLIKIRYNKPDVYIKRRVEPWLHGVPILFALITTTVNLVTKGFNPNIGGTCQGSSPVYFPPHCTGFQDGEIPPGFTVPCGRGRNAHAFKLGIGFITMFLVPIIVGVTLFLIYKVVSKQERIISTYGAGSLGQTQPETTTAPASDATSNEGISWRTMAKSIILYPFKKRGASRSNQGTNSRAVLQKATAFSLSYFVTWIWVTVWTILNLSGVWLNVFPQPTWQIVYNYFMSFMSQLQGLWNFLIFMHPKVMKEKRSSGSMCWCKAFPMALWLALGGRKRSPIVRKERPPVTTGTTGTGASTTISHVANDSGNQAASLERKDDNWRENVEE